MTSSKLRSEVFGSFWTIIPPLAAGVLMSIATPVEAQTVCLPLVGSNIVCSGPGAPTTPPPLLDVTAPSGPITATLGNGFVSPDTVRLTTLGTAADVTINALGTAAINTINQPGLVVNSTGNINGRISPIATSGNGASGAVLRAADNAIFTSDDIITTVGNDAPGLDVRGNTVNINSSVIRTAGANSNGAQLVSLNGPINLDADAIDTSGDNSTATLLRSTGNVNLRAGVLQTQGSRALGVDIASDPAACVLLGRNGCSVTAAADQITTNGFGGIGALVAAAGPTTVNVGALQTGGDEAAGLNLAASPTACVVLGAGACDTNFTVGQLTTQGARSPGALVRAAGNVTGNVSVLRTNGANAAGLDLASNPDACVVLGKGNCGTSFNVGQLTTAGPGATGVLVRAAGPTTGRVGVLGTTGANSPGIDLGADPTACALIGSGACDVGLTANQVTTRGDGSGAVLINAPGNVIANIGTIATDGNNSPGLSIITNPAACLVLGPGSCGITASTGTVTTTGTNSPGVTATGGNDPVNVTTGTTTTRGDNSPGIVVTAGPGPADVTFTSVTTTGANSPGVAVSGTGPIRVNGGTVTTTGPSSGGVVVTGAANPVLVSVGAISTSGPDSNGVTVTTTSGNQTIVAGPVRATGPRSNGVVATSPGCSTINITATQAVSASQGTGILASSACSVTVTTLPGAAVSGSVAGIDVTSGTGSTITVGDAVSSTGGPAINANGAATVVTVTPTGTINGAVDLTDGNDQLINNGTFNAAGNSTFGAGNDSLVNNGVITVGRGLAIPGAVALTGLESLSNNGLIDLRNGVAGDVLTVPGTFTGMGASTVGLDVSIAAAGSTADRLVVGGAAAGSTALVVNQLGANPGILVNNLVLVDAGAGSSPTAFTLAPTTSGLVQYGLVYNAAAGDYALFGTPSTSAYELVKVSAGAREIFYRTNDAASGHMQNLRDSRSSDATSESRRSSALWGQLFGSIDRSRSRQTVSPFGQAQTVVLDNSQDIYGGQIGYDFGDVTGRKGSVFGVTAGYANSTLDFRRTADRVDYQAINGGVYAGLNFGPFFLNALAKYEHYFLRVVTPSAVIHQKLEGNGYGGMAQAGVRLGSGGFFVEPSTSLEYVRTAIDTLNAGPSTLDFDNATGLRGKAGVRIGTNSVSGAMRTSYYASGNVVHEFRGRSGLNFANSGQALDFGNDRIGTYGRGVIGFNIVSNDTVSGFMEASGDLGNDYRGYGLRAGLSVKF